MQRIHPWTWLKVVVALIYLFMLGPIVITTVVSFNEGTRSLFPPEGFSLRWWHEALTAQWLEPVLFSLQLASLAARLGNESFVSRAPAEVVAAERVKEQTWREQRGALAAKLKALGC